ncbi:MAG: hypothetical protein ACUVXF_01160 [Desulfobaccales bacterium]
MAASGSYALSGTASLEPFQVEVGVDNSGTFSNNGADISYPSQQTFDNLVVGETGYLVGFSQDIFEVTGDFETTEPRTSCGKPTRRRWGS